MPTITATLKMFDAMTKPLQNITNSMNLMIRAMENMQNAANRNVKMDQVLTAAKKQLTVAESEIRRSIEEATKAQQRFNQSVQESKNLADSLSSSIKRWAAGLAAGYLSFQGMRSAIQATDTFVSTQARLDLIVDEGQSVKELSNMIFAASQRARGDFVAMADNISRLGLLAGEAFESTAELVAFTETMQKAFKVSGASIQEQTAAMYQLSQAMAAGRLQGDEFRSVMENAPMLADAIAKFTGKSKGELKEMSAEGVITADIIKGALFAAADDINAKFEQLPKTFGDVFQGLKNEAFYTFGTVFERMNAWLNSAQGATAVQLLTNAIHVAAVAADWLITGLQFVFNVAYQGFITTVQIAQNLGIILAGLSPLILGVASAWLTYLAITKSVVVWTRIKETAIKAAAAAQRLLNTVMAMNPILRVISLIVGLVTAILILTEVSKGLKQAFSDAFGFVVDAAEKAVNAIIGFINGAIRAINKVSGFFANLLGVEAKQIEEIQYRADFQSFKQAGKNLIENFSLDKVKATFGLDAFEVGSDSIDNIINNLPQTSIGKIGKVGEVGKIRDTVDISSEDLKVMRELAEMKSIQNFVTLTPTVNVTTGDIRNDADIDTVIRRIEDFLEREIANSAQGVYS